MVFFLVYQLLDSVVFQWFSMIVNHLSNDGMVKIHRYSINSDEYRNIQTKVVFTLVEQEGQICGLERSVQTDKYW